MIKEYSLRIYLRILVFAFILSRGPFHMITPGDTSGRQASHSLMGCSSTQASLQSSSFYYKGMASSEPVRCMVKNNERFKVNNNTIGTLQSK